MGSGTGIHVDYLPLAACEAARWDNVLGVATFNQAPEAALHDAGIPAVEVSTPVLSGTAGVREIWRTDEPSQSGRLNGIRYRSTDSVLLGCMANPDCTAFHRATEQAYRRIYAAVDTLGYPHLLRVWNYLPEINRDSNERYQQFNSARQDALRASGRTSAGNVPAASALGTANGTPFVIYFLASRAVPTFIENPRQVSAYHYPPQYGIRSPVFSRATLLRGPADLTLFISGTASIVGHETAHIGDVAAQTRETLANIEALLQETNRVAGMGKFTLQSLACKVYVRNPQDLAAVQAELTPRLGSRAAHAIYLQADICRQDLLVEIEALGLQPES